MSATLTRSEVFRVHHQLLHGFQHLRHRQVLQDTFADADYLANLRNNWVRKWAKVRTETMMQPRSVGLRKPKPVLVPAVHVLPNDGMIVRPADIPACLYSASSPALCGRLLKSTLQRKRDVTPWLMAPLSPVDCWARDTWKSAPRELSCLSDSLCDQGRTD